MPINKVQTLSDLMVAWDNIISEAEKSQWQEGELLQALTSIRSKMFDEGVLPEYRYDAYELNDTILQIRSFLHEQSHSAESSKQKDQAKFLWEKSQILLEFLLDIHRITNVQNIQYPAFEDKEIKQELYNLFDRPKAKEQRKELRMRIMIRLIELCCPDKVEKEQKQFAQKEFVERGYWNVRHKGKLWKELKTFWQDSGSPEVNAFALDGRTDVSVTDPDEEVQALWDALDEKQRQDRKLQ